MKRIMKVYDSCRISIRIAFFGFLLIAIGSFIQNDSVNIFYTFKNTVVLFIAEGCLKLGTAVIVNLPLIFMLNLVCKRANSAYPVCLALIGYFTFLIVTSLFSTNSLASSAYASANGINSLLNINTGSKMPLELGLLTSFIVAYLTRLAFVRSRHRTSFSLLGFLHKDSAGIVFNVLYCTIAGIIVSYIWPPIFNYLQFLITFISQDLMDPLRLALYGVLDRFLSVLSLNTIIRQPFWYTALGGSLQTISGQSIVGDINIWNYIKNTTQIFSGAGRFVTAYYVINMFIVPAIYLGFLFTISDKQERSKYLIVCLIGIILSVVFGNPLPIELVLLFSSPLLFVMYLVLIGTLFYCLTKLQIFLGSSVILNSTISSMPGNFPDFIINLRNINYIQQMWKIVVVGVIFALITFIMVYLYNRYFAYDLARAGKAKQFAADIINAVGGSTNINLVGAGLFKVCIHLKDLELVDINAIQKLKIYRVTETKDGIDIECGSSALIVATKINYLMSRKVH